MRDLGRVVYVILIVLCTFILFSDTPCASAQSLDSLRQLTDSLIQKIDNNNYTLGNLTINKQSREIVIPGTVNMSSGPVEYLAVTSSGKTHESVLVLDIRPLHLQLALFLLGLDCGQNLSYQGDSTMPVGDLVELEVSWRDKKGNLIKKAATDLIRDTKSNSAMQKTRWIFSGSRMHEGYFVADEDGSIIAVYNDPSAILNNPLEGRGDDTSYEASAAIVPVVGTSVNLTVKAKKK